MAKSNEVIARLIEDTRRGKLDWKPLKTRAEWELDVGKFSFYLSNQRRELLVTLPHEEGRQSVIADSDDVATLVEELRRSNPLPELPTEDEKWQRALNALEGSEAQR